MKLTSNTKILRKLLILCLLTIGLGFVASKEATPVSAKTCWEAINDFSDAMNTYDSAFRSYYLDDPTSCDSECSVYPVGSQLRQNCVNNCQITRHTALGDANIGLLQGSADINTCTNPEPNYCANAQAAANACQSRYNYNQYSDPEQHFEIFNAYMVCRDASGIDSCQ